MAAYRILNGRRYLVIGGTPDAPSLLEVAPKGMGSIDLSTLSWEDYLLVGIIGMGIYAVAAPDSSLFKSKPKRRRARRKSGSALGTVFAVALVGGLGYLIYSSNA